MPLFERVGATDRAPDVSSVPRHRHWVSSSACSLVTVVAYLPNDLRRAAGGVLPRPGQRPDLPLIGEFDDLVTDESDPLTDAWAMGRCVRPEQAAWRMSKGDPVATKRDFKRELSCYKAKRETLQLVTVPDLQYLMIDGHGDPNTPAFTEAAAALYPVAYKLKFASKKALDRDYVVMPLEGLWWADTMESFTDARDKAHWDWTLMMMVPDWITAAMFIDALEQVAAKARTTRVGEVRLATLSEGLCAQALHVGSYDDEAELLRRMHHEFIPGQNLSMVGTHHEIYLSNARKVEPARLRTILRQPVRADTGARRRARHRNRP
jgi:hypothetical protein